MGNGTFEIIASNPGNSQAEVNQGFSGVLFEQALEEGLTLFQMPLPKHLEDDLNLVEEVLICLGISGVSLDSRGGRWGCREKG